jgi:hypothetical protein
VARTAARRSPGRISATSTAMLVRRKPWMKRAAAESPSCAAMSSCTSGVAVAVKPITGAGRSSGNRCPRSR